MPRYKLEVCKGSDFNHVEFTIPLDNAYNDDDAIREANRLKDCLKDGYTIRILGIMVTLRNCGYLA